MSVQTDLEEFHTLFEHTIQDKPAVPNDADKKLRIRLIVEEFAELLEAISTDDLIEIADGAADLVYVVVGLCVTYGIPFDKVFKEVHRTNMAKAVNGKHIRDAGGKTIKPEGWQPPDIGNILFPPPPSPRNGAFASCGCWYYAMPGDSAGYTRVKCPLHGDVTLKECNVPETEEFVPTAHKLWSRPLTEDEKTFFA